MRRGTENVRMMFDCGWSLREIAAHYRCSIGDVIKAIRAAVANDRKSGAEEKESLLNKSASNE